MKMKMKSVAIAVCSILCGGAVWTAVNTNTQYVSMAESTVDISAGTSISGWSESAELMLLTISFDKDALSTFAYDAMDTEEFAYILDYLCFNGKTVKEINADTSLGALGWEYTQFPGNANDKYKVPVLVYQRDSKRLRLYIHKNYLETLGGSVTFELKEGLQFVTDGTTYKMNKTRGFTLVGNTWTEAKETTDVTANVTSTGWDTTGTSSELKYTRLSFGAGVLPTGLDYGVISKAEYQYIQEYITINGKTIKEINTETDVTGYNFATFPSTIGAPYNVPVIIFANNDKLEIKVHSDYLATLGVNPSIVIGVKAGLSITNGENVYAVTQDVNVKVYEGSETVDITNNITAEGWDVTGGASELTYTRLSLGESVLPEGVGYGIIDSASYQYIQDYITINGKTVKEINTATDVTGYNFATFPSTIGAPYNVPVIIYVNNGKLEIKVHNNYVATLGQEKIVIGVKSGAYISNGATVYTVSQDVALTVKGEVETETVDISGNVTVEGWDVTGNAGELTYTRLSLGESVLPEGVGYGIIDKASYQYIQDYITINGKTVKEINTATDVTGYNFATFPSTIGAPFNVPVIVYENNGKLEIKVHNNYVATLGENEEIVVGVKAGLTIDQGNVIYTVANDVAVTVREAIVNVDITENVTIGGWSMTGDLSELTYTIINFGEGVLPTDMGYHAMDSDIGTHYQYVQDYITINGQTVREINANTDVSSYVFHSFPYTAADKYKLPVLLFANKAKDQLEIKIHNDYIASLGGNIDVIIGVKAGLTFTKDSTIYTVSEDVEDYARRKQYVLTVELNPGVDEQYLTVGSEIVLTAPDRYGYVFDGWYEKGTDNAAASVMPESDYTVYAKYIAIEYTVTFMDGETVVGTATYTLDNTNVIEPTAPTKEGYTSAWEAYELTGGDITVNVKYTIIEDDEDSSSEDSSVEDSSSEDSSVEDSSSEDSSVEDSSSEDITSEESSSNDITTEESSTESAESPEENSSVEAPATSDESSSSGMFGCGSVASGMSVAILGLGAAVLLKKKENE